MYFGENLCRLCANTCENYYQIFGNVGRTPVEEKIQKCLKIKVYKRDIKPKQICEECNGKLDDLFSFVRMSEETDVQFDAIINRTDFRLDNVNNETVLRHSSDYDTSITIKKEEIVSDNVVKIEYIHTIKPDEIEDDFDKRFKCYKCNKSFKRKNTLRNHVLKHSEISNHRCRICDKWYKTKKDLIVHNRVHTDQFKCNVCEKTFTCPSKLHRHVRIHTGDKPFVCPIKHCGMRFTDKSNLIGHELVHRGTRDFQCAICKKRFQRKAQLKDHKLFTHSNVAAFTCGICGKSCKWKNSLIFHMKKHNGDNDKIDKKSIRANID